MNTPKYATLFDGINAGKIVLDSKNIDILKANSQNNLEKYNLGQVFTPQFIVEIMLGLVKNNGRFLEPSCGDGAFFKYLPNNKIGIEIDKNLIFENNNKLDKNNFTHFKNDMILESNNADSITLKSKNISFEDINFNAQQNIKTNNKSHNKILNLDFFAYNVSEKFDTIIGNPPYVRYQDIVLSTKNLLQKFSDIFDERSNLYLFFIYKSILHLQDGGELIFITPRDFIKSTASVRLNEFIFLHGDITHFFDLGDKKIFTNAQPNCAIWRFEKGKFERRTHFLQDFAQNFNVESSEIFIHNKKHKSSHISCENRDYLKQDFRQVLKLDSKKQKMIFNCINGQLLFTKNCYTIKFSDLFFVKVGAVSGADYIFTNDSGNMDFVCSFTRKTGKTKRMIYGDFGKNCKFLIQHKDALLSRKIKKFNETNWWHWGRDFYKSDKLRIYVNTKTRNNRPFFIHKCISYDGSILAIFPKFKCNEKMLDGLCEMLNNVNWQELGFVCDGRFLFSQKSLEGCVLGDEFNARLLNLNV